MNGAEGYLVGVRRGGLDFERMIDTDSIDVTVPVGESLSVCVAAIDARGHVSMFSPEVTLK